jgi:ATP-binding cassette subfamily B protein
MSGVRHADRIYVLNHGRLAEHGTHDELMTAQGRYAAMFDAQAAQYAPNATIPNPAAPTVADPA